MLLCVVLYARCFGHTGKPECASFSQIGIIANAVRTGGYGIWYRKPQITGGLAQQHKTVNLIWTPCLIYYLNGFPARWLEHLRGRRKGILDMMLQLALISGVAKFVTQYAAGCNLKCPPKGGKLNCRISDCFLRNMEAWVWKCCDRCRCSMQIGSILKRTVKTVCC